MGAAASINNKDELASLTAEELAITVASFGNEYTIYKDAIISQNLTGKKMSSLSKDEQIAALKRIGITDDALLYGIIDFFVNAETLEQEPIEPMTSSHIVSEKSASISSVVALVDENESFKKLIQSTQLTVVDFTTKWYVKDHVALCIPSH